MDRNRLVGHIVGFTYETPVGFASTNEKRLKETIPLVQYPDGRNGVHHKDLLPYRDGFENFQGHNWDTLWAEYN